MAYKLYMNKILYPIAPAKIQTKITNKNKTITLANQTDINILKSPGLREYTFELLLPNSEYPFAIYKDGFKNADYYLRKIKNLKENKKPFKFKVLRGKKYIKKKKENPNYKYISVNCSLEDYTIIDDATNGLDVKVNITLKQYISYGIKIVKIKQQKIKEKDDKKEEEKEPSKQEKKPIIINRDTSTAPTTNNRKYTVKKGDCLWAIAKIYYGDGSKYGKIYSANSGIIEAVAKEHGKTSSENGHWIWEGTVLIIP